MSEMDEGFVVVAFRSAPYDAPGRYGLVPSEIWRNEFDVVPVIRGPRQPEERIAREDLYEEECRAVQVTKDGFYTCEVLLSEDFQEAVKKEAEKLFEIMANERAAEAHSYIHDGDEEKYGDEIFKVATFGDAVAVNGDLVWRKKDQNPPRGYIKDEELSGWGFEGEEEIEISSDGYIARGIRDAVEKSVGRPVYEENIQNALIEAYAKGKKHAYVIWGSGRGDVEVWVSKKAWNANHKREEQEERLRREAQDRAAKKEREQRELERELERKRQVEEEKRKRREGGYPLPEDWDPRGYPR